MSQDKQLRRDRLSVTVFTLMAICLVLAGWGGVVGLRSDLNRPIERIDGRVAHLHPSQGGRGSSPSVTLQLETSPRTLVWKCGLLACGAYGDLFKLGDEPWPMAEAYHVGDHLVGLRIGGRTYLHTAHERERLIRGDVGLLVLLSGIALAMLVVAAMWLKRQAQRYRGPDPDNARHMREHVRGLRPAKARTGT